MGRKYGEITSDKMDISKKLKEKGFVNGTYLLKSSKGGFKVVVDQGIKGFNCFLMAILMYCHTIVIN